MIHYIKCTNVKMNLQVTLFVKISVLKTFFKSTWSKGRLFKRNKSALSIIPVHLRSLVNDARK